MDKIIRLILFIHHFHWIYISSTNKSCQLSLMKILFLLYIMLYSVNFNFFPWNFIKVGCKLLEKNPLQTLWAQFSVWKGPFWLKIPAEVCKVLEKVWVRLVNSVKMVFGANFNSLANWRWIDWTKRVSQLEGTITYLLSRKQCYSAMCC